MQSFLNWRLVHISEIVPFKIAEIRYLSMDHDKTREKQKMHVQYKNNFLLIPVLDMILRMVIQFTKLKRGSIMNNNSVKYAYAYYFGFYFTN